MPEQLKGSTFKGKTPLKKFMSENGSENGTRSGEFSSGYDLEQWPEDIWLAHMA